MYLNNNPTQLGRWLIRSLNSLRRLPEKIDIWRLWREPPNESPAGSARRYQLIRHLRVFTLLLAVVGFLSVYTAVSAHFGLPFYGEVLVVVGFGSVGAFVIVFLQDFGQRCPRCGWNINLKKPTILLPIRVAILIPDYCIKCGYDLEQSPPSEARENPLC